MEVGNKCLCPDLDSPDDVERRAVNDMKNKMLALRRAIMNNDSNAADAIYDYLLSKSSEYANYSGDGYDIVTCSDFAYDAANILKHGTDELVIDELLDGYDRMFNPSSPKYHDFSDMDNVVHDSSTYTGPDA